MEEKHLLKIAFITGILGLLLLFIILEVTELPITSLENVSIASDGTKLRVFVQIDKMQETNKTIMMRLSAYNKKTVDAVYFKKRLSNISAEKGMIADITATPYNGKLIINSLKCVENCS